MAFKFELDPAGNIIEGIKSEAVQEAVAPSGFNFQLDESGNIQTQQPQAQDIAQQYGGAPVAQMTQQYQAQAPQEATTWEQIRDPFTGELRETEETRTLPEMTPLSASEYTRGIDDVKSIATMLIAADDEGKVQGLKSLIPGLQDQKDSKGNIILTFPDGKQQVLNAPGFTEADAYQLAFDTALFLPGGLAGGAVKGVAKKAIAGAIGAGVTEAGRQQVSQELDTGEKTDIGRIALAAGAGALAEGVPAAVRGRKAKKAQERLGIAESQAELAEGLGKKAKRADVITEKTGVEFGRAQKTGGISDAKRMNYVAQLPAAEQKAMKFLEKQNKQAYRAVNDLMDTIAPAGTVGEASRKVRGAAKEIIKKSEAERATAARPFYEKAFADKTKYSPESTIKTIDSKLAKLPESGTRATTLNKVKGFLKEDLGIEQLDEVKVEIDGMIESAIMGGEKKLAGQLRDVKSTLLKEVDELNPDYKKAREIYSKRSPGIEELKESTIGQIAKKKDSQIKTVARELFEPDKELFDPAAVKKARTMIEKQDPEAWAGIVRAEWQRRLGKARLQPDDLAAGENIPGKLRSKIFGTGKERESLYSAMSQEQKKNARYLEEALKRAEKGRPGGSPTAANQVFEKELRGAGGVIRGILSTSREKLANMGMDAIYDARTKALADVMFDPKWQPKMTDLRRLSPSSAKAERRLFNILKKVVKSAAVAKSPESPAATRKALEILNKED